MKRLIGIVAVGLVLALNTSILAQTHYEVKSHNVVIEGTSNLHDWTADVENLKGNFRIKVEDNKIVEIENLTVKVDANSLKGSRGNMMNSKIYEALNSKKHPEISFELRKVNSISENPGSFRLNTTGVLQVSGVSKPVNLNATGKLLPSGEIEFAGSTKIKMSDFSVKPPTAMFGALTTGDEVNLKYTVVVKPNLLSDK
ncbi:MAG: YceI family protein [Tenuifilaceae bacterium]|jgi:polyisoprenoid-binding protein YceI|uniref:YceI family protein n=1 Tax=Perlabentimonas gracilis TaxID=2715279 RepID=UPI00140CAC12|nr:YceI family protein [Perlabentimonas gracilis]MDX9770385.1 YceI family protein [Tenuifilaceae bacterium]NHB70141.1 YceI family protein [Perlabentimonas gracilis]